MNASSQYWLRLLAVGVLSIGLAGCAALQPRAEPPEVEFEQIRLVSSTLQTQRYAVKLRVFNPNRFDVPIRDLTYLLDLDGQAFASGQLDPGPTLPARQTIPVELMFETDLATTARRAVGWFLRGKTSVDFRLTGEARIRRMGVPTIRFEESGTLTLDALHLPRQ
jgi:LEA14-like dessication related protein